MTDSDALLAVVEAIADAEGAEPHELEYSLYEYVDTQALWSLVGMDGGEWKLTFRVPDHEVSVDSDGEIRVDGELGGRIGGNRSDRRHKR